MNSVRAVLAVIGSVGPALGPALLMLPSSAGAGLPDLGGVEAAVATAGDGAYDLLGWWAENEGARQPVVGSGVATGVEWDYQYMDACVDEDGALYPGASTCPFELGYGAPVCEEGETPRPPRWRRFRVPPSTTWSAWEQADYGSCAGAAVLPALTAEDFRRLPLPAPVLHVQPEGDWVLTNIETIVYTDPAPVTLTTELLGFPVTVEATPSQFTYEWGDGHSTVTRDPGRPYPAFDVVHEYEAPGQVAITLTTQWTGRYQVVGDLLWRDVAGTASTSVTGAPFEVQERTSRLVSGTCFEQPDAPGCEGFDPNDVRN